MKTADIIGKLMVDNKELKRILGLVSKDYEDLKKHVCGLAHRCRSLAKKEAPTATPTQVLLHLMNELDYLGAEVRENKDFANKWRERVEDENRKDKIIAKYVQRYGKSGLRTK